MNQKRRQQNKPAVVETLPAVNGPVTPMVLLQQAQAGNAPLEQLEKLMEMQMKWEENEARKAFYDAVAKFKAEDIEVTKDKVNTQFASRYSSIGNLVNTVNPILAKYGLSASWNIDQAGEEITVSCALTHELGYKGDPVSMTAPPDKSGGNSKNPIQQVKSTITYLKIATYEAVTGVASYDDPGDNDGNTLPKEVITEAQVKMLDKLITDKEADREGFLYHFNIESLEEMPAGFFPRAKSMLEKKQ